MNCVIANNLTKQYLDGSLFWARNQTMKSQSWRQHLMKKFTPRQNKLAQTQQIRPFRQRARTHLTKFDANNNQH